MLGSADKDEDEDEDEDKDKEEDEERDEKDDVVASRPPPPQMDNKIIYNTELPRCSS